jgi:hypothetical protein
MSDTKPPEFKVKKMIPEFVPKLQFGTNST